MTRSSTVPAATDRAGKPAPRSRDAGIDNVKGLLIALVVVGHTVGQFVDDAPGASTVYTWVYLFHMPAFVLLCGLLARPELDGARAASMIRSLLLPFVVLQVAYTAYLRVLGQDLPWSAEGLLTPVYHLWFLVALFVWRALAPFLARLRAPVATSVAVSLAAGTAEVLGNALALNRVAALLPFFVIGMVLGPRALAVRPTRIMRGAAAVVLVASVPGAAAFHDHLGRSWLFWRSTYDALGATLLEGSAIRGTMIVWALLVTAAVVVLLPRRRTGVTTWGERSTCPYLLHAVPVQAFGWADVTVSSPWHLALAVVAAVGLTAVLASAPVRAVSRPLLEPHGRWLVR